MSYSMLSDVSFNEYFTKKIEGFGQNIQTVTLNDVLQKQSQKKNTCTHQSLM